MAGAAFGLLLGAAGIVDLRSLFFLSQIDVICEGNVRNGVHVAAVTGLWFDMYSPAWLYDCNISLPRYVPFNFNGRHTMVSDFLGT